MSVSSLINRQILQGRSPGQISDLRADLRLQIQLAHSFIIIIHDCSRLNSGSENKTKKKLKGTSWPSLPLKTYLLRSLAPHGIYVSTSCIRNYLPVLEKIIMAARFCCTHEFSFYISKYIYMYCYLYISISISIYFRIRNSTKTSKQFHAGTDNMQEPQRATGTRSCIVKQRARGAMVRITHQQPYDRFVYLS